MSDYIQYRFADKNDLHAIAELLRSNNLPTDDISRNKIDFLAAINSAEKIIGCIGIEKYGEDALLRSFAVDNSLHHKKIGTALLERLIAVTRQTGIHTLHLLTTTAESYFLAKGFLLTRRDEAPASIKSTTEFSSLCPSSSAYMVFHNTYKDACCYHNDVQLVQRDKETGSEFWSIEGKNLQLTSFVVSPHTAFEKHRHSSEQITYVIDGELFVEVQNRQYKLASGDSIVIPADTEHKVWTGQKPAKAIDAWSPVNSKFTNLIL